MRQWGFSWPIFVPAAVVEGVFLQPFGGRIVDDAESEFLMDEDAAVEALQFWIDLHQVHGVTAPQAIFNQNNAAMEFNGSWNIPSKLASVTTQWDVAHVPAGPAKRSTAAAGSAFAITEASNAKDAAWLYLKELLSPEGQSFMWGTTGRGSPSRRSVWPVFLDSPGAPANGQVFPDALVGYASIGHPIGASAQAANNAIFENIPRAIQGEISLPSALETIRTAIEPRLNRE